MQFAVIFDLDGVLVDSAPTIQESFGIVLGRHGIRLNEQEIKSALGTSVRDLVKIWKEKYGFSMDCEQFSKEAGELQFLLLARAQINPVLLSLLDSLEKRDVPLGIGTASRRWRAERILDILQVRRFFSSVVTADDVPNHKPDPDVFLAAAKALNMVPSRCVVIEDAPNGIEAAKRAGMKAIGLLNEFHSQADLARADWIIRSFSELSYEKIRRLVIP